MEPEARYTIVGTVVVVLVALLAVAAVWLHSSGEGGGANQYRIDFVNQSLEGLAARSDVTMRGLRVGTVTGYRFSARRPGVVEVFIEVNPSTPVLESTRASIRRNLFTGLATVQLVNADQRSAPLQAKVIAEGESSEQQLTAALDEIARRLSVTLSPENQAAFAQSLANVQRLTEHADRSLAKVDVALDSLTRASDSVGAVARSAAADGHTLAKRYDKLGMEATGAVREAANSMRDASQRANTVLVTSDSELRTSSQALRSAAESVGIAADRLREPSEIIYGPPEGALGPGEGKR